MILLIVLQIKEKERGIRLAIEQYSCAFASYINVMSLGRKAKMKKKHEKHFSATILSSLKVKRCQNE